MRPNPFLKPILQPAEVKEVTHLQEPVSKVPSVKQTDVSVQHNNTPVLISCARTFFLISVS